MEIREKTITVTVKYKVFEVGERVTPTSSRCPLESGVYVVTRCEPPEGWLHDSTEMTDSLVFVEGRKYGISAEYLTAYKE